MRLNLAFIFLFVITIALAAIFWKIDGDFYAQKIRWNESQSRSQISAITHSIEAEVEGLTQVLDLAYPVQMAQKSDYNGDQVYSQFHMFGKIRKTETSEFQFENIFYLQNSSVKKWAQPYAYFAIKNLQNEAFENAKILIVQDPQKKPWLLFLVKSVVTHNIYAALLPKEFFQKIVDRQKGQLSSVTILNQYGQAIAHSIPEYIGLDLRGDELVKEISTRAQASGSGFFAGRDQQLNHGFYQKVESNDLYVSVSTSMDVLMAEKASLKKKFLFLGVGAIFIGLALIFIFDGKASENETLSQLLAKFQGEKNTQDKNVQEKQQNKIETPVTKKPEAVLAQQQVVETMPPAPILEPDNKQKKEFENLFGERKIAEAFDMIDHLDGPPRKLIEKESSDQVSATKKIENQNPVFPKNPEIEPLAKMEEIAPIVKPLINMQRREYKSDKIDIDIRRPGAKV